MRGGLESDPWGLPALLAGDGAVDVNVCGGLRVGGLELLGARAYDPTSLKPLTDAELNAYTDAHTGWHAGWNWLRKNKDYIFGGAMVIAGGIMAVMPAHSASRSCVSFFDNLKRLIFSEYNCINSLSFIFLL